MTGTIQRFDDAGAFYDTMRQAFAATEVAHSLALGSARYFAERAGGKAPDGVPMLAVLDAASGTPVATALRVPPYDVLVCCIDDDAVDALADAVITAAIDVPGVIALAPHAMRFAELLAKRAGRRPELRHEMPFYTLGELTPPPDPPPGRLRPADPADAGWLVDWLIEFAVESGQPEHERDRQRVSGFVGSATENKQLFFWEWPDGRPATIAAYALTGITGARIGRVMTTPSERGRGAASAAVSALSKHVLDNRVAAWCGLFADAKNPQSNRIYQRLGYREACRYRSIRFD